MFEVKAIGLKNIVNGIDAFAQRLKRQEVAAVKAGALILRNQWVQNIKDGVIKYPKMKKRKRKDGTYYKTRGGHKPSTGTYARSVSNGMDVIREYPNVVVRVGCDITNPPYPLFLELGTKRGIKPRLWATNAYNSTKAKVINEIDRILTLKKLI